LPVSLGLAHGVSDCAAGVLLGSLAGSMSIYGIGSLVLIYNLIAFGGQPVAGIFTDKLKSPKIAALAGLAVMCLAIGFLYVNPVLAVVLAGVGSAAFHVGGGALALCATPGKASGPGYFSAPGVAGLAIGGYLAISGIVPAITLIVMLVLIGLMIAAIAVPEMPYGKIEAETDFDKHDLIMLILLMAIALRSAVWNIFQYIEQGEISNIILISFAAASGKVFGGYMGDKIGWRRYSIIALSVSIPFLLLGSRNIFILLPGIALLQSVTPILTAAVLKTIPKMPATSAGLTFGLAIAVGGLPFAAGFELNMIDSLPYIAAGVVLTTLLIWFALKRLKRA